MSDINDIARFMDLSLVDDPWGHFEQSCARGPVARRVMIAPDPTSIR